MAWLAVVWRLRLTPEGCITSTHFRCVRLGVEDDGVSSRFGDFIPIGNFLVLLFGKAAPRGLQMAA
jgi:hypothetical protein